MIKLNYTNYRSVLPLDIVAFDYAASGACGDGGGVNIITAQGEHYYLNRVSGDIEEKQLAEILPFLPFKEHPHPEGWSEIYMGLGNQLYVRKEYYDALHRAWKEYVQTEEGKNHIFYNVWQRLVINVIKH